MREILFRGKRLDNGEWIEGNFYESGISGVFIFRNETRKTIDARTGEITLRDEPIPFEVRPSTVGQYTGLMDKNDKPIFEGDVVQWHERQFDGKDVPVCDAVVYEEGGFAVSAYFLSNWLLDSIHGNIQLSDVEIIGNIYDNPELIGGDTQNG